jgi:hypothetical protein
VLVRLRNRLSNLSLLLSYAVSKGEPRRVPAKPKICKKVCIKLRCVWDYLAPPPLRQLLMRDVPCAEKVVLLVV